MGVETRSCRVLNEEIAGAFVEELTCLGLVITEDCLFKLPDQLSLALLGVSIVSLTLKPFQDGKSLLKLCLAIALDESFLEEGQRVTQLISKHRSRNAQFIKSEGLGRQSKLLHKLTFLQDVVPWLQRALGLLNSLLINSIVSRRLLRLLIRFGDRR